MLTEKYCCLSPSHCIKKINECFLIWILHSPFQSAMKKVCVCFSDHLLRLHSMHFGCTMDVCILRGMERLHPMHTAQKTVHTSRWVDTWQTVLIYWHRMTSIQSSRMHLCVCGLFVFALSFDLYVTWSLGVWVCVYMCSNYWLIRHFIKNFKISFLLSYDVLYL